MRPLPRRTAACACLSALLIAGCGGNDDIEPRTLAISFDTPTTDWVLGASDYSLVTEPDSVKLEVAPLPAPYTGHALTASGQNRSDDLFLYVKKRYTGLVPGAAYEARVRLTILASLPKGCFGVGGAPAESVYVKAGVAGIEPLSVLSGDDYRMNIDKGNQSQGGSVGQLLGDLSNSGSDCVVVPPEAKTMSGPGPTQVRADADGAVWVFFGIDSGFEAGSGVTLMSAGVTLTPTPN